MDSVKNLVEYYDELFPATAAQQKFYEEKIAEYPHPAKLLSIGCGTGVFEHRLAKNAVDVTGLETQHDLLESASRKYRNQLMALRYFQMSTLEMTRFLGKGFYNIISCLNSRVLFIHDQTLMRKFFFDCRQLLSEKGTLILQVFNLEKYADAEKITLPERESVRVRYREGIQRGAAEKYYYDSVLVKDGRTVPVYEHAAIYPLKKAEIAEFAKEAGFSSIEFYADFSRAAPAGDADQLIAVVR